MGTQTRGVARDLVLPAANAGRVLVVEVVYYPALEVVFWAKSAPAELGHRMASDGRESSRGRWGRSSSSKIA